MAQSVGSRGVYEYITQYDSSGYNGYATIDCIVDHWWDDPAKKPTFMGTVNSLCNNPNGSANYVVEAGKVACLIAPGLRAWHVRSNDFQRVMPGIYDINSHSIGIECNPRMTDDDIETLCQLHADLWIDYGKVPIYGHKDFMATQCPGTYYDRLDYIRARTEEIYNDIINGGTGAATEEDDDMGLTTEEVAWVKRMYANSVATEPDSWFTEAMASAVAKGITDGERPRDAAKREEVAVMIDRAMEKVKAELPKAQ